MSKWIVWNEEGESTVMDFTDEEAAVLRAARAAAQAEEEEDGDEDDDDEDEDDAEPARQADTPAEFKRVEAAYRQERAAVRVSQDPDALAQRRASLEAVLDDPRQSNIAHTRARDLLGEIEQRELKLRAERLAERRR